MSKQYNFDHLIKRDNSDSIKWQFMSNFDSRAKHDDILPFWVADMDLPCAEPIIEALHRRIDQNIFGYSNMDDSFYRPIIDWYRRRFNWQIERENIFFSPGIVSAISFLIQMLTKPGEGIIIQPPVYYPFAKQILAGGRQIVDNPLICDQNGYYSIDFDDLAIKLKTHKILLFCSPHNPVGRVWQEDELKRLVKLCAEHQAIIISDEIHNDLLRRNQQHFVLENLCPEYKDNIITMLAPSKTFNLAGLQFSHIIINNPQIKEQWLQFVDNQLAVHFPNCLSISAVRAAYQAGEPWLEQVLDYLDDNINFAADFIAKSLPQAIFCPPQGSYLLWLNLKGYNFDDTLYGRLIEEGRVLIEHGIIFGECGKDYVRINIACPKPLLKQGLERIAAVINAKS